MPLEGARKRHSTDGILPREMEVKKKKKKKKMPFPSIRTRWPSDEQLSKRRKERKEEEGNYQKQK